MKKSDIENLYRFVACISQGMEYFDGLKDPMLELQRELLVQHYRTKYPQPNAKQQRWINKKILDELSRMFHSMQTFEKRAEAIIMQFDLSNNPNDHAIIDTMIDQLTDFLKGLEIEIKD